MDSRDGDNRDQKGTSLTSLSGNLIVSDCQTITNATSCVGVMGKGISSEFKRRFREMYADYVQRFRDNKLRLGAPMFANHRVGKGHLTFQLKTTGVNVQGLALPKGKEKEMRGVSHVVTELARMRLRGNGFERVPKVVHPSIRCDIYELTVANSHGQSLVTLVARVRRWLASAFSKFSSLKN